ncbi:protein kinase domain-containing protein [Streptomyces sp. NPDC001889]
MSEAEQSREPQQDESTDPKAPEPGGAGGASRGTGAPDADTAAESGTRSGSGARDTSADADTDAAADPEVEPSGDDPAGPAGDGSAHGEADGRAAGGAAAKADAAPVARGSGTVPRQTTGKESVTAGAGEREAAARGGGTPRGSRPGDTSAKPARPTSGAGSEKSPPRETPSGRGESAPGRGSASGRTGTPARDSEGRLLSGRYRLGGVLGRGGMGTVWRAVDETLGRTVAVKELRFPNSIDDEEKRRLITRTLREAKAIARIRNNSAVTVYDVVDEDDRPWIVMELVEGKSLAEVIREDGTLTPRRAAEVGLAILDVLRSAHREGILHRDVKPSNVLIADDGRVVLTDFGIAQVEGDPSITSTGMLVGAPSYISPERARGHRPGPAADLWSLGGLLYASVEGCPPYDKGSAIATLTAVMTESLDPPKNAGPLEEVIYGLLAKDPAQRLDDRGARALLTKVVFAPETAAPEPPVDATRAMALPPIPQPVKPRAKSPAADRGRGGPAPLASAPAVAPQHGGPPVPPVQRARAPLTDVVSRRTLAVIAAVVVLAVVATVLYLTRGSDGDGESAGSDGKGDTTASTGARTPGGGEKTTAGETGGSAEPGPGTGPTSDGSPEESADNGADEKEKEEKEKEKETDSSASSDAEPDGGVPDGYTPVSNGRFRFAMAMPEGFTMTGVAGQNSGGIFSRSGGFPRVQVDFNSSPGDDAAAAWNAAVPGTRSTSTAYKHLGVREAEFNGYPTVADWEFERRQQGDRIRVLNRGFKVDEKRGYSIMVSCRASEWNGSECTRLRETAFDTFKPKG